MQFNDGNNSGERGAADTGRGTDLRSMAVLDALGMLDEVDAAQFDRAFRDAAPSVQAELGAIQSQAATDPAFLGSGEPPAELRLRTLAAVMTAVERQETAFAPIAHIGRTAARSERRPVKSIDARDLVEQAMELSALRKDVERFTRSSYYWRAAAIALTAALTVALVFQVTTSGFALKISQFALGAATPQQIFDAMGQPGASARFERASFTRGVAGDSGTFSLAVDTGTGEILGLGIGLQAGGKYTLRHRSETGFVTAVGSFVAQRETWGVQFDRSTDIAALVRTGTLELVDARGNVVMRS